MRLPRPARGWRTVAWTAAALIGAIGLGAAYGEYRAWPWLRDPMARAMTQAAGVPVLVEGEFGAHLIGHPRLAIGHLQVASARGVGAPYLVDGRDVELAWRWSDLWNWRQGRELRLLRLRASRIDARLVRLADGRASWQLGPNRPAPSPGPADQARPAALPRIDTLIVEQGRIEIDDAPLDTQLLVSLSARDGESALPSPSAGPSPPGSASGPAPDAPRRTTGGPPRATSALPVGYHAQISGRWRALPLHLDIRTGGLLTLVREATDQGSADDGTLTVRVEGEAGAARVFFDGRAAALMSDRRIDGELRLRGPSLARVGAPLGVTLPDTPPFELRGRIVHTPGVWHLRADRAAIGKSLLAGDFRFDQTVNPPRLTGELNGPRLALADLGPAVGTAAPGPQTPAGRGARVLPQRAFDLPSLRAMNADVQVAIDELDFGSESLAPFHQLRTQLILDNGVLQLRSLKAVVAGGQVGGWTELDARGDPARWAARLQFGKVDIAGWIRAVQRPKERGADPRATGPNPSAVALRNERATAYKGGAQPVKSYITGELTGELNVTGAGRSTAAILGTLDGQARMMLREGTVSHLLTELAGLDIAQGLGVLVRGDRPLPLSCARFELGIHDGVITPQTAVIDNRDSLVRIDGHVDLKDESLALRATVRPKDFSLFALRTPLTLTGTLGAPRPAIDARRLAGRVAAAVALGTLAGPAALLPFIDLGSGSLESPCTVVAGGK